MCQEPIQTDVSKLRINIALRDAIEAANRWPASQQHKAADPKSKVIPWAELSFERDADGERVELGRGSFGSVYAAEFSFMKVAVKVCVCVVREPLRLLALRTLLA